VKTEPFATNAVFETNESLPARAAQVVLDASGTKDPVCSLLVLDTCVSIRL